MNLKYYLRGLGIGVIVTALIMGIASSGKKETLSDSEIIERAKALGMTEETTLIADAAPDNNSETTAEPQATATTPTSVPAVTSQPAESTAAPAATAISTPAATASPAVTPQPTVVPTPVATAEPVEENPNVITIQINSGDGSYEACKQLEEAGLVESASAFDRYLYDNGFDKRINVGTFAIPLDAEPEQIAKILARME